MLSSEICDPCNCEMLRISSFKKNLIENQKKLNFLLESTGFSLEARLDPIKVEFIEPTDEVKAEIMQMEDESMEPEENKSLSSFRRRISRFSVPTSLYSKLYDKFPCYQCDAVFAMESAMRHHAETVHTSFDEETEEKSCAKPLSAVRKAKKIICVNDVDHHKQSTENHPSKFKYACDTCHKGFMFKYKLNAHLPTHCERKLFTCDVVGCDKNYATLDTLKDHKTYHQQPSFQCEVCHKMFHKKNQLLNHMSRHYTLEFPCSIDGCTRSFRLEPQLVKHKQQFHSQVSRFSCDLCNNIFANKNSFKKHLRNFHVEMDEKVIETKVNKI